MTSRKMSFFEFWRSQKERGEVLKRAGQLRLHPSQLKQLLGDSSIRAELQNARTVSLLPPVGTEVFRRFTPASLQESQRRQEAETEQLRNTEVAEKDLPKPAIHLEAGKPLPFIYGDPPPQLLNTPLEELDPFYQSQKTFIVLSKGNIIHRFNAGSACYLLSPFSAVRTFTIKILNHFLFRLFILLTLLINCIFMSHHYVFLAIYTFEVFTKVVSRGFCIGRFTFLRDPWNWLDVLVISTTFLTVFEGFGKVSVLRVASVLLKLISVYPGMRMTAGALVRSVKRFVNVTILMAFSLSILSLIGLQLFMGTMRHKCVQMPLWSPSNLTNNISQDDFHTYINSPENYYYFDPDHPDPLLCGNSSNAGGCPEGFSCLRCGKNPNYGFTNFDSFGWSLLSLIRLMGKDYWENLLQLVLRAADKISVFFFVLVLSSCFCLISLFVAVVAKSCVEQDEAAIAEAKRKEEEFIRIQEVMKRREKATSCREELSEKQDSVSEKKNSDAETKIQEQEQAAMEEPEEDQRSCCSCWYTFANLFLKWNCCGCWRWFKQRIYAFVMNPFFDLGIVLCIVLNIIFVAMIHYPMTMDFEYLLSIAQLVFTSIFTLEMILKIIALDPYGYFKVGWNIFEFFLVVLTVLELFQHFMEGFGLMRVFRLGRWWPTFNLFLRITGSAWKALRNLTLILFIMVFLFSVVGMQLFFEDYGRNVHHITMDGQLPRWHMHDFFHTFILVIRILCGEWIETLWDCMEVSGQTTCLIFYFMVLIVGNLLVLSLFLGLLLSSICGDNLEAPKEKNNVQIAINQICRAVTGTRIWILKHICPFQGKKNQIIRNQKAVDSKTDKKKDCITLTILASEVKPVDVDSTRVPTAEAEEVDLKMPENEEEKKQQDDDKNHEGNTPEDCCCDSCYCCCPVLDIDTSQGTGRVWSNFRRACLSIVRHKCFEAFVIFIILLSSAVLVFEDIHLQQRPVLQRVLDIADLVFTVLFLLEMVLKWIALGFKKYFTCAWCWLDFVILAVSLMSLTAESLGYYELGAGLSLRIVRALRPLRILSRFQGLRVVLRALAVTLRSMWSVLLVIFVVWLFFCIVGVDMFAGKYQYCYNETTKEHFSHEEVNNFSECLSLMFDNSSDVSWRNHKINYDNVAIGYLALLQVATLKGWLDIMYAAVDSTMVESQPVYEDNLYIYQYFILFIFIGCFFTSNLFIRVFIDTMDMQRHKFGGKHVFMTEEQQRCSRAMKKRLTKTPMKPLPRPQGKCRAWLFDLVTRPSFEVFMVAVICLNMVILMLETDQQSTEKEIILYWCRFSFFIIFFIEFLLKIIALRHHYFTVGWNILDFVVLFVCTVEIFFADIMFKYLIAVTLFPMLRLARIFRILHLCHCGREIQKLLLAFGMSLPAVFNVCLLLFLLMFTYSIFGMIAFAHVKKHAMIDDMLNFETFVNSMICMFVITTTAGWDGFLQAFLQTPPDCDREIEIPGTTIRGNCGDSVVAISFFTSYILLSVLLMIPLYISVILEVLNVDDPEQPSDDDLQMFYKTWTKFDPDDSQVILYSQLSEFCDSLQDPLKIPKPNTINLVNMDLPLLPGDKIRCSDVLLAVTTQVFGDSGEKDALKARLEEKFTTKNSSKVLCEPISSTLRRKQEEVAAAVIQRAYRKHLQEPPGGASGV
ncbi:sodium channel protein type 4 subunit alpha B-like isoform X2 [Mastacembelus armatus]|uniref:sodium channel protein type 4 subunit alpha B-like isoform X2 n=1 Tax=Mastacembelus armatus TaxID=205130 RepID=UPI000E45EE3A|nr:sodium channel protein type 4 subunit alpha B-like isoform X2 [Mastacembelus armatus]